MSNTLEATSEINLTMERLDAASEPSTSGKPKDIINRDPTHLNDEIKVEFNEVIAEPHQSDHASDSVWEFSEMAFRGTKLWCYRLTTLVLAVPLAAFWGLTFACLSFWTIWCYRPFVRASRMQMVCCKDLFSAIIDTFCRPFFEAVGYVLYNARIHLRTESV